MGKGNKQLTKDNNIYFEIVYFHADPKGSEGLFTNKS